MIQFLADNGEAVKKICGTLSGDKLTQMSSVGDIVQLVGKVISIFQIAIPIILVVLGLVSLGKAVVASKDDEVKKATSGLVKKIVLAAAIFFIVAIVKLVIGLVNTTDMGACWHLINYPWSDYSGVPRI